MSSESASLSEPTKAAQEFALVSRLLDYWNPHSNAYVAFPLETQHCYCELQGIFLEICHEVEIRSIRRNLFCIREAQPAHSSAVAFSEHKKAPNSLRNSFVSQSSFPLWFFFIKAVDVIYMSKTQQPSQRQQIKCSNPIETGKMHWQTYFQVCMQLSKSHREREREGHRAAKSAQSGLRDPHETPVNTTYKVILKVT